jgi:hypothetical protein
VRVRTAVQAVGRRTALGVGATTQRSATAVSGGSVAAFIAALVGVEEGSTVAPSREGSSRGRPNDGYSSNVDTEWGTVAHPVGDDAGSLVSGSVS